MGKWKRIGSILFVSFVVSAHCVGSTAEGENLISNPGFEHESNGMQSWSPKRGSNAMNATLIEGEPQEDIKTGKRSLRLEDAKANGCVGAITNATKIRVNVGDKLLVKFWCKGSGKISAGFVEYREENGKLSHKTKVCSTVHATSDWKENRYTYTAGSNVYELEFCFLIPDSKTNPGIFAIVDDISVTRK